MTQVIPITLARKNLLKLVDEVDENYTRVDLTKNGKIKATLVSSEYLDSLEETIFTLENSMSDIRKSEDEIANGDFVTLEDFKKELLTRKTNLKRNAG